MDETSKLREVYKTILHREWIVQGSRRGITGPIPPDGKITDEYIAKLRAGEAETVRPYQGGLEQNIAIPGDCWPMIEDDFRVLRRQSQAPGYSGKRFFEMAADMLVLAQAGVIRRDNYSESTDLYFWKIEEKNANLFPRDSATYHAVFNACLNGVGKRDQKKDQDLIKLDRLILAACQ